MEQRTPLVQPLLNASTERGADNAESTAPRYLLIPASASSTSAEDELPPKESHRKPYASRLRHCFTNALALISSGWRSCARTWKQLCTRSWTAETCSYILSIMALAGLIVTLLAHQTKPLPQWPQMVTINSIISLFSLLMRACVGVVLAEGIGQCKWRWYRKVRKLEHMERLDLASRGSWGSITLLYHLRIDSAYCLAALGAIITIIASLTGFFLQQLIQFKDCKEITEAAVARISKTNNYTRTGVTLSPVEYIDYIPMIAAINVGLIQAADDYTNVLTQGCTSGNCTFPSIDGASFSTVAISHRCENITAQLRPLEVQNDTMSGEEDSPMVLDYDTNKDSTFPKKGAVVLKTLTDEVADALTTINIVFKPNPWNLLFPAGKFEQEIPYTYEYMAFNCSLYPVVNTYAVSINGSVLEEHLVDSVALKRPAFQDPPVRDDEFLLDAWDFNKYKMVTNHTLRDGILEPCDGSEKPERGYVRFMKFSDEPTYVNSTGHTVESVGWRWWHYPPDCIWSFSRLSERGIQATFAEIFHEKQLSQDGRTRGIMGPIQLRQVFSSLNTSMEALDGLMHNLTTAMTAVIRSHGEEGLSGYLYGDTWSMTTCMYTRWPWITFPVVMIGLTGVFLVLVAIENHAVPSDRLWKSSFLAALFCELDISDKPTGKEEMAATAKSSSVSVEGMSGALRLVAR